MKERYKNFTAEDFIHDTFFYEWVTAPTLRHDCFWQLWLHLYPEKRVAVEQARQEINRLISERHSPVADHMEQDWQQVQAAMTHPKVVSPYRRSLQPYAVAACFLLLLSFGLYFWWQGNSSWKYMETAYGEQQTILLPDGSQVTLNGNSQLRYAVDWKDMADRREVWLDGEAFFQVTRQNRKITKGEKMPVKFTVHTSRMQVEVLGTRFNVRSRKKQTQVVLSEGSVLVHDAFKDSLLLQPGEMAELNEQQHRLLKQPVNAQAYTSWKEQELIFDNEVIAHIFRRLEDTYGWKIETNDKDWLQQHYTGSVPTDQTELLFDKLATLYEMRVGRQGKKVWFDKK